MRRTKAFKAIEKQIETAYYAHCAGVVISIMDIPKVYAAGHAAAAAGGSVEDAVVASLETFRVRGTR